MAAITPAVIALLAALPPHVTVISVDQAASHASSTFTAARRHCSPVAAITPTVIALLAPLPLRHGHQGAQVVCAIPSLLVLLTLLFTTSGRYP